MSRDEMFAALEALHPQPESTWYEQGSIISYDRHDSAFDPAVPVVARSLWPLSRLLETRDGPTVSCECGAQHGPGESHREALEREMAGAMEGCDCGGYAGWPEAWDDARPTGVHDGLCELAPRGCS